ncbi:MAG: 1-acyl-sn-glycerol-3-phosphate acyltransferase [Alphaproteobacteria bacterium]|jgi:1-acyl-sn-glycerol-3-phosphate acyltransferase|nr:1-acyl-sn-glycerol-3-phosphate acyltransferase [Alphaproteobacteria bacterium]
MTAEEAPQAGARRRRDPALDGAGAAGDVPPAPPARIGSDLLGAWRIAVYGLLTLSLMPVQALAVALRLPLRTGLPVAYHRLCLRVLGFDVEVRGAMRRDRPTLFVANHSSYLDITVLGALIPGSFVAKREVGTWPLFGWLARLQRTVFVDRKPSAARTQRSDLERRLAARDALILFPEGTSSDGNRVLPFKSALFAAAEMGPDDRPVTIQPVTIVCTRLDGIPLGRWLRPMYAWYGDMDLVTHIWQMARLGRLGVTVEFHDPVDPAAFPTRKALARHCWQIVGDGMSRALAGRDTASADDTTATAPAAEAA